MKYITDLVASDQTKYLYVLDKYPSNRVKKIDPVGKTSTEFIDLGDEDMLSTPIALSVQKDHMLIIPKFAHKLSVYDISSGQLLKTLQVCHLWWRSIYTFILLIIEREMVCYK